MACSASRLVDRPSFAERLMGLWLSLALCVAGVTLLVVLIRFSGIRILPL